MPKCSPRTAIKNIKITENTNLKKMMVQVVSKSGSGDGPQKTIVMDGRKHEACCILSTQCSLLWTLQGHVRSRHVSEVCADNLIYLEFNSKSQNFGSKLLLLMSKKTPTGILEGYIF
jgi:hypothetical protein